LAEEGRQQVAALLDTFAEVVRTNDAQKLKTLLAPGLPEDTVEDLVERLRWLSWTRRYEGYTLDAEIALERVRWQDWSYGNFWLYLSGSNAMGEPLQDDLAELARAMGKWCIRDFDLQEPQPGDLLNVPASIREAMRPEAERLIGMLKAGKTLEIFYGLPREARYRPPQLTGWERVTRDDVPEAISIYQDLEVFKRIMVGEWPPPGSPLKIAYGSRGRLVVVYELPYEWPTAGIHGDKLRVEIHFVLQNGVWSFFQLRLFGRAVPFTFSGGSAAAE
jgi:hypothetical protein